MLTNFKFELWTNKFMFIDLKSFVLGPAFCEQNVHRSLEDTYCFASYVEMKADFHVDESTASDCC